METGRSTLIGNWKYSHNVRHPGCVYNKIDWSVCNCLTQLYDGRDMYRIYYIKNNYMFRHFSLAIFRLICFFISQPEDGQRKVPKHVVVLHVINSIHISTIIKLFCKYSNFKRKGGTAVTQWLRFCASNREVAGSIPDGVSGIFIDINTSDRTMALASTQPLTEMSTRNISWG